MRNRTILAGTLLSIAAVAAPGVVADDSPRATVEKFVRELRVDYPIGPGPAIAKAYGGAELLPQTFFIRRDGRIASIAIGLEDRDALERRVRAILHSDTPAGDPGAAAALSGSRSRVTSRELVPSPLPSPRRRP